MNNSIKDDNTQNEETDQVFQTVVKKLNEHGIPWWITAGSMLGCYREGKRIEWDYDYDIAYPLEYAPKVLEALLELPNLFIYNNLIFKVDRFTDILNRDHFVCVMPHIITEKGIFKVRAPFRHFTLLLSSKGFHTIPSGIKMILSKIIRKLPLRIQKAIVKLNMQTFICVRYRGPLEEYSYWEQAKMGDVDVKLPNGVESILERHYGKDFMTPTKKEDYSHEDKGLKF